ncbi:MAG: hypothetical protein GXX93_02405 [Anaerolineae bacterium]|nr:hypothetical protein [Anaerolineae bacterium]
MQSDDNQPRQMQPAPPPEYYVPAYYYEDEIDLHDYVNVLVKYWWIVIGLPVVAVALAAIVGFVMMKPTYEATSLVAITRPRYVVQFTEQFETVPLDQRQVPLKAYPSLATSSDLLTELLPLVADQLPEGARDLRQLQGMVSARSGSDASLIELTVTAGDPEVAANIANVWALRFADKVEEVYGQTAHEIEAFEEQLGSAAARRDAAEAALVEFQSRNNSAVLQAQIGDKQASLSSYLAARRSLERVNQDATALSQRLSRQPGGSDTSYSDEITALLIQMHSLVSADGLSLQLQLPAVEAASGRSLADQIDLLDSLVAVLQDLSAELETMSAAVEPELLALQAQLESVQNELNSLKDERDIARELYQSISLKLDEARLSQSTNGREIQVAAQAIPPLSPSGPRKMMMIAVAGALGLMLGVFGAFVVNFFVTGPKKRR